MRNILNDIGKFLNSENKLAIWLFRISLIIATPGMMLFIVLFILTSDSEDEKKWLKEYTNKFSRDREIVYMFALSVLLTILIK